MIVKKFQAPTETEAILKAKDELGSNAVVLNVKTLKQRGIFRLFRKDVVEVTAALEENEFISNMNAAKHQPASLPSPEPKVSVLHLPTLPPSDSRTTSHQIAFFYKRSQ